MGVSHHLFQSKQTYSLGELQSAFEQLKQIVVADTYKAHLHIALNDLSALQGLLAMPCTFPPHQDSFDASITQLEALSSLCLNDEVYQQIRFHTQQKWQGAFREHNGWSLKLDRIQTELQLGLTLYYKKQDRAKEELLRLTKALIAAELMFIPSIHVDEVMTQVYDMNSGHGSGRWSYEDSFKISAAPDWQPPQEKGMRPSSVYFTFSKRYFDRWKTTPHQLADRFVRVLQSLIDPVETYSGMVHANNLLEFAEQFQQIDGAKYLIHLYFDLEKASADEFTNLLHSSYDPKSLELELREFRWKGSNIELREHNAIHFYPTDENSFQFELTTDLEMNPEDVEIHLLENGVEVTYRGME